MTPTWTRLEVLTSTLLFLILYIMTFDEFFSLHIHEPISLLYLHNIQLTHILYRGHQILIPYKLVSGHMLCIQRSSGEIHKVVCHSKLLPASLM